MKAVAIHRLVRGKYTNITQYDYNLNCKISFYVSFKIQSIRSYSISCLLLRNRSCGFIVCICEKTVSLGQLEIATIHYRPMILGN